MEFQLGDARIHFEVMGTGRPIVMLHGWPYDHTQMKYDMEPIFTRRPNWQRIYIDLPGMGRTEGLPWVSSSDDILALLEQIIRNVISNNRFLVAGMSYGGYLARGLVYKLGSKIDGVLLNVPSAEYPPKPANLPIRSVVVRNANIISRARSEQLALFTQDDAVVSENASALEYARMLAAIRPANGTFLARLRPNRPFSFDVDTPLMPFNAPSLIILGRQDHLVGYARQLSFVDNYRRATVVVMDGAGHYAWGERPILCESLTADWLSRVEEYAEAEGQ